MRCDIVLMGFAVYNKEGKLEYSYGFEADAVATLSNYKDPNYRFLGFTNTGAYACEKRGVEEPLANLYGHIRFQGSDYEGLNREVRLNQTQKVAGNRPEYLHPTVALVFQANTDHLLGAIVFTDAPWSSFKGQFFKNLNFFLHPFESGYDHLDPSFKNGCRPPNGSIILPIDLGPLERECAYQLEHQQKAA